MPTLRLLLLLPGLLVLSVTAVLATPVQYLETFETTAARDATATTALWDTVARELRIEPIPMAVVGGWDSPGGALSLAVAGDYAFLADGLEGLHIIDITDPENPSLVSTFNTPGSANDVAIAGNYAFVADNTSGLRVIDISNPAAPVAAGAYDTPGSAYQVVLAGNYAYVADGSAGLRVVNISNPTAPVSAGTYDTTEARDLVVAGDDVYVADGSSGLRVISVANPASPVLRTTLDTPGTASGVAIWGNYLVLADGTAGIHLIYVGDPAAPILQRTLDTPGNARNVAIDGNWVYVADVSAHVLLFEIQAVGSYIYQREDCSLPGTAYNIVTAGGHAYVAAYSAGLQVLRISESRPVVPEGTTTALGGIASRVMVDGVHAFVTNGSSGLRVINLNDPADPDLATTYDTDSANGLDVDGNYAYVSDGASGLKILDIRYPTVPVLVGSYPGTGTFYDVTVDGDHAFVANQSLGVRVLNVSNPAAPTLAGTLATTGWAWTVAVDGDLAYVAEYDAGVRVLNVTNPAAPVSIGLCNTPGLVTDVAVHGDYVYAADGTAGLKVINVLNPASPYIVGACDTPGIARNVVVAGDVAYVADGIGGLQIIDVSDPANPVIVDAYDTDDSAYDVVVAGNHAYLASSTTGVQAFGIRERILATSRTRAQSLALNQPGENLLKVKLSTVQAGSISWQVNAVDPDGSPWQAISPGGAWVTLAQAGDRLAWGCTLTWGAGYLSSVCTQVAISWLAAPALIASVSDIPGDQGGRVRLAFARSAFDFPDEPGTPITGYNVWRRVDDAQLGAALAGAEPGVAAATGDLPLRRLQERSFHVAAPTFKSARNPTGLAAAGVFPAGIWESMGTVLPVQQDQYLVPVATLADSAAAIPWAVYCITAHTATPSVWYASPPDSGWSVDNLAPAVPAGLHREPGNVLVWLASPAADFQYFSVYGSAVDHLDGSETLLEHTTDTSAAVAGSTYAHYLVTATDCHGNESEAAALDALSAVPGAIASALRLYPCQPNPFNPRTTIRFDLPASGPVRVSVYDVAGRLIRTLVDESMPQGRHEAIWDGRDSSGRDVGSGSYLARLSFDGRVETVHMGLVR